MGGAEYEVARGSVAVDDQTLFAGTVEGELEHRVSHVLASVLNASSSAFFKVVLNLSRMPFR